MTMRNAKFSDIPQLVEMLRRTHAKSKYAERAKLHDKAVHQLLMGCVAGQNQKGPEGSFLQVVEDDGKIVAFMAGALNRVYNILDKLSASDIFLISESNKNTDILRLIDAYVWWAGSNHNVIEIGLSWSDAIDKSSGHTLAKLYSRKGFTVVGEQYELRTDSAEEKAA